MTSSLYQQDPAPSDYDADSVPARGGLLDHLNAELEDTDQDPPSVFDDEQPAPARRQPGQLIEVLVEGQDAYTVTVANRELIEYEKVAARHREWPHPTTDNPEQGRHFQMTFCTFVAARRAGRFEGTFDQWCAVLEDWNVVRQVPADPTR